MEPQIDNKTLKIVPHHVQQELCKTRPPYRQGRNFTAVKVYTIANESQHLFIYGVPQINLRTELKSLCQKYGTLSALHIVTDYETEIFTECFHAKYDRIQSARIAKRLLDNKSFYGGVLHVCYAPEYENLQETRAKFLQRSKDVLSRLPGGNQFNQEEVPKPYSEKGINRKRKHPALPVTEERIKAIAGFTEGIWNGNPMRMDPVVPEEKKMKKLEDEGEKKVYGPQLPHKAGCSSSSSDGFRNLVPSNVMKSNKLNVVKRIVFRKSK